MKTTLNQTDKITIKLNAKCAALFTNMCVHNIYGLCRIMLISIFYMYVFVPEVGLTI